MSTKLTEEEIKYNSILATQKSLIELGAIQQKEHDIIVQKNLNYNELYTKIMEYNNNLPNYILQILSNRMQNTNYKNKEILLIIDNYNKYFTMNNEVVSKLKSDITKLEEEYKEIKEDYNNTNKEYDEKQIYWENRVLKLREKCMDRNKSITLYEQNSKYSTYNIIIKNTIILVLCLIYVDIEYLSNYIVYMTIIVIYSYYSNIKAIQKLNNEKIL